MTNVPEMNDITPGNLLATIDAFMDGEPVAPEALKGALADPGARDYLIDLLVLRGMVVRMDLPATSVTTARAERSKHLKWFAAAAAVLISLFAGYFAGQRMVTPIEARTVEAFVESQSAPTAPKPTRIITLRPGVNWTESTGER